MFFTESQHILHLEFCILLLLHKTSATQSDLLRQIELLGLYNSGRMHESLVKLKEKGYIEECGKKRAGHSYRGRYSSIIKLTKNGEDFLLWNLKKVQEMYDWR